MSTEQDSSFHGGLKSRARRHQLDSEPAFAAGSSVNTLTQTGGPFGPQAHYAITMMGTQGGTVGDLHKTGGTYESSSAHDQYVVDQDGEVFKHPSLQHAIVNRQIAVFQDEAGRSLDSATPAENYAQ